MAIRIPFTNKRLSLRLRLSEDVEFFASENSNFSNLIKEQILKSSFKLAKRIVLVSFNGIGDYLYATPAIRDFRREYPDKEFCLAVSKNSDNWNNPLVYDFAKRNPNIDFVYYFDGINATDNWFNYNWTDAKKQFNENETLYIPFFYSDSNLVHRIEACYNFFGLAYSFDKPPVPLLYLHDHDYSVAEKLLKELNALQGDIVFVHLETRSSNYIYTHAQELINGLVKRGKRVVIIGSNNMYQNAKTLVLKDYSIFEISALLDLCKEFSSIVSVNSVFYPISSAIGIKNVGFYILNDDATRFLYDNILALTKYKNRINNQSNSNVVYLKKGLGDRYAGRLFNYYPSDILKVYDTFIKS